MLEEALRTFPDTREGKNRQYAMVDLARAAFAVFFCQSPSFLAHQQLMEKAQARNNARTLFPSRKYPATTTFAVIWMRSTRLLCAPSSSTPSSI